jgi:NAD(P)-dependent dehydrogenase (short-subunit alcohol dehydrogenase family)
MNDKLILVTGSNTGIGFATALELARSGATVIASARDAEKGRRAVEEMRRRTGNEKIELLVGDLGSLAGVHRLADDFLDRWDRLDVLINNAGLILSRRSETEDGFETTFAVNHLAPFLLTHRLLGRLKDSSPSRIVNVASRAHVRARLDFDDLHNRRLYRSMDVYSQSKLANILFTRELARRLEGTGVTANCLHPGVVRSDLGASGDMGGFLRLGWLLVQPFFLSPEKGARTSIYLAQSPDVADVSGEYFDNCRPSKSSSRSRNLGDAERLWTVSAELCGIA